MDLDLVHDGLDRRSLQQLVDERNRPVRDAYRSCFSRALEVLGPGVDFLGMLREGLVDDILFQWAEVSDSPERSHFMIMD